MDSGWVVYLIPIVAIIGGITAAICSQHFSTKRKIAEAEGSPRLQAALETSAASNAELLARLGTIEARLGAIEKTLNDVA